MGKLDGTKRMCGKYLFRCALILSMFPFYFFTSAQAQSVRRESQEADTLNVKTIAYKSAFKALETVHRNEVVASPEKICYTIQICSLTVLADDPILNGRYQIKVVRIGELYRYIFSSYATLDTAHKALSEVRKIFPEAFIREYDGYKLGKAIDLKI